MSTRHPALARLEVLIGRWHVQIPGVGAARTEFSWQDGGAYLRQSSDIDEIPDMAPAGWREHAPFPTVVLIGLDDANDRFTMLYSDARGVHRVYQMTFADGEWRIWRDAPAFNQRFIGALSPGSDVIESRWEMSKDGVTWDVDFELSYTRIS